MAAEDPQEKPSQQQSADAEKAVAVNDEPQEEGQETQVDPGESLVS